MNKNLMQLRKKLFWQTKVKAKKMNCKYYWSVNGNIYIKKSDNSETLSVKSSENLSLIKLWQAQSIL